MNAVGRGTGNICILARTSVLGSKFQLYECYRVIIFFTQHSIIYSVPQSIESIREGRNPPSYNPV